MLHNNLLSQVLRWSVGIFDITPIGRIVNRFAYDIDVIDNTIIQNLKMVVSHVGTVGAKKFVSNFMGKC